MPRDHRDTLDAIEEKASLTQARLRRSLDEIGARSPVAVAGSMLKNRMSARAKEMAATIRPAFRGRVGVWVCATIGAALAFELGRTSAKPGPSTPAPAPAAGKLPVGETASMRPMRASQVEQSGHSRKAVLLGLAGLAGGAVLSAFAPPIPGETDLRARVSSRFRDTLRDVVGANGTGLVKLALRSTGASRYAASALVIVSLLIESLSHSTRAGSPEGIAPAN